MLGARLSLSMVEVQRMLCVGQLSQYYSLGVGSSTNKQRRQALTANTSFSAGDCDSEPSEACTVAARQGPQTAILSLVCCKVGIAWTNLVGVCNGQDEFADSGVLVLQVNKEANYEATV